MTVWYELTHRPIGLGTQPKGFIDKDYSHVNRNGFKFGKVAYSEKLDASVIENYDLEPVHIDGKFELSSITRDWLTGNQIRATVEIVQELVKRELLNVHHENGWDYISYDELVEITKDIELMKNIYKELKKA